MNNPPPLRASGPLAGTPRKAHGIGFKASMVLANHDGRKRMTRRVVSPFTCNKSQDADGPPWKYIDLSRAEITASPGADVIFAPTGVQLPGVTAERLVRIDCRYQVGDLIWQRETWQAKMMISWGGGDGRSGPLITYRADGAERQHRDNYSLRAQANPTEWRPSIHMPRWASRSLYEITGMRAELVTDISPEDAIAEGVTLSASMERTEPSWYVSAFRDLWDTINLNRGYPWGYHGTWSGIVWVIEYKPLVICGKAVSQ